ncbi:hypothetical protein M569_00911, partial [Genlisea aurea]
RLLQKRLKGVVDFPVQGTYDPFLVGLYFTRVKLGNPAKEFYVQIDTGSDVLWISCDPCAGCPKSSGLEIQLEFFDPSRSSTSSHVSCSDPRCDLGTLASDSACSDQKQCVYTFLYGDGSGTSGFYVYDTIHLDTIVGRSMASNSSASIVFGCSSSQTGDLTKTDRATDGIFGFGQQGMSVISQLSSQGITPAAFSHCLKGDGGGGGILVLGEIMEPDIVYTPLVTSQPHYNVNLQNISVNGLVLNIDSSVFATTEHTGTIIDSGTTLAYLAEAAYEPFLAAVTEAASKSVRPLLKRRECYLATSSIAESFPNVSLNFDGGASLKLTPRDYLLQENSVGAAVIWCVGIQKTQGGQGISILGDLILKDKIVVYDLANQKIGWKNYDCSSSVNVSASVNNTGGSSEYF